jgi:hypothetical protein
MIWRTELEGQKMETMAKHDERAMMIEHEKIRRYG